MNELIDTYASLSLLPDAAGGEQLAAAIQGAVAQKGGTARLSEIEEENCSFSVPHRD